MITDLWTVKCTMTFYHNLYLQSHSAKNLFWNDEIQHKLLCFLYSICSSGWIFSIFVQIIKAWVLSCTMTLLHYLCLQSQSVMTCNKTANMTRYCVHSTACTVILYYLPIWTDNHRLERMCYAMACDPDLYLQGELALKLPNSSLIFKCGTNKNLEGTMFHK